MRDWMNSNGSLQERGGNDLEAAQVIVDDRHQLLAQRLEVREVRGVHHGQAFAEHPIPDLDGRPGRKVVGIGARDEFVPEKEAVGVVVD